MGTRRIRNLTYGAGNLGVALFYNTIQTWLIFFYVDVVRLDSRLVGLAFAVSYGVWNAVNDPILGILTDRTRTRWGRRVPWIAAGGGSLLVSLIGSREPPQGAREPAMPLLPAIQATLINRSFVSYMAADLMICFIWSWLSAMVPFFCKYAIRADESQTSLLFAGMFGSALLFYPVWRKITLRLGSKAALTLAVVLFVLFLLPLTAVRTFPQAVAMMFVVGAAHSGTMLVREILLGDVIDEDELATGRRREGSYFGVAAFIERLVMILIGGATGLVLTLSRYDPKAVVQPDSVGLGVRLGMGLLPAAALAVFLAAMRFYPLGRDRVTELRRRLEASRAPAPGAEP